MTTKHFLAITLLLITHITTPKYTKAHIKKTHTHTVMHITTADEIKTLQGLVILDVFAQWCPPCQKMAPIFKKVAKHFKNLKKKVTFAKIEMESFDKTDKTLSMLKKEFDVSINLIPSFIVFKDGKVITTVRGSQTEEQLHDIVSTYLHHK